MNKIILAILCSILGIQAVSSQQNVKGYVFNDVNKNGIKDRTEKGVPGVGVSNGKEVVVTDAKGEYKLPVSNDATIFVIKPKGYKLPKDGNNLPQFYYIHKPAGSPESKYKGISPTGKLPKEVNFSVIAYDEPEKFRVLVFGDPQVKDKKELEFFNKGIVSELENVKNVAFGLTLGDLVQDDLTLHKSYAEVVSNIGIPWFNVIGNHDLNIDTETLQGRDETYTANFGPATYSFNYGKAHVIVLDDNYFPGEGRKLTGGFMDEQFTFLENDLKLVEPDQLVILGFHIPLFDQVEADRERLFSIIEKCPNVFALSAHTHNQRQVFYGKSFGWKKQKPFYEFNVGASCGNWWSGRLMGNGSVKSDMSDGTPKGYAYLNIDGNQFTADYKVANMPADYQIGLYNRKVLSTISWWDSKGYIYANFFMGYEESKVECSIDGGEWKPMKFSPEPDPAFVSELFKWNETQEMFKGRRPTEAANSTHLWRISQPNNIGLGKHTIKIRAYDVFGRVFYQDGEFKIEEAKFE